MAHPDPTETPNHRYLQVADLRRLRHVLFAPRGMVDGRFSGKHRSPQLWRGGIEFADYRAYTPGDEVSALDWKVYGRTDRLYVKRFEHETDMTVHLLIDGSASMAYAGLEAQSSQASNGPTGSWMDRVAAVRRKRPNGTDRGSKFDHACRMAAAVAFLTLKQQDRVGFALAQGGLKEGTPAGTGPRHLRGLLTAMEKASPTGDARLPDALDTLTRRTGRRGLLILFSDLLGEDREAVMKRLAVHRARGTEIIVFHVLHPDELELPQSLDDAVFVDSESGRRVRMNVPDARAAYHARLHAFLGGWSGALGRHGIDYNLVSTATPSMEALERYLFARAVHTA